MMAERRCLSCDAQIGEVLGDRAENAVELNRLLHIGAGKIEISAKLSAISLQIPGNCVLSEGPYLCDGNFDRRDQPSIACE